MPIPVFSYPCRCVPQLYAESLLAIQQRAESRGGTARAIPLVLMTSDDTHDRTVALLEQRSYFGLEKKQVRLVVLELLGAFRWHDDWPLHFPMVRPVHPIHLAHSDTLASLAALLRCLEFCCRVAAGAGLGFWCGCGENVLKSKLLLGRRPFCRGDIKLHGNQEACSLCSCIACSGNY